MKIGDWLLEMDRVRLALRFVEAAKGAAWERYKATHDMKDHGMFCELFGDWAKLALWKTQLVEQSVRRRR